MKVLKSIKCIDEVIISDNKTAIENINKIKPDIYIKGKDYKNIKNDLSKQIIFEKKAVEKYGGRLVFTNTELHSSSSIANNVFDYINDDIKKILKNIDYKKFEKNFLKFIEKKISKKILIIGDPILDVLRFVEPSGKSNKSNVISTKYLSQETNAGGVLLVANFLNLFCSDITLLFTGENSNLKLLKKLLNKNIKILVIKTKNKLIRKIRYIDNYSNNRFFQNSFNEKDKFSAQEEVKLTNKLNKIFKKYEEIILFDYGYVYSNKKFVKLINSVGKKLTINCQSNSYNFGYNIADKYKNGKTLSMDEAEFRLVVRNKEEDLGKLIGKNMKIFNKFENLIITQGKKGCFLRSKNNLNLIPSIINQSIDSTGSGDIFLAMFFISKIYKKFCNTEAIILAHIAAGLHSNNLGNRFNLNSLDILRILNNINK